MTTLTHSIKPEQHFAQLKDEILKQNPHLYTFDFKNVINENGAAKPVSAEDFWRTLKIKAQKVPLFVDEILSCEVTESVPHGFIREISMAGGDVTQVSGVKTIHITERVVIDDRTKTILFFQLETNGEILLFAINHVSEEHNVVYFSGHYVYSVSKNSKNPQDQAFMKGSTDTLPSRFVEMIERMKALARSDQFEKIYQELVSF